MKKKRTDSKAYSAAIRHFPRKQIPRLKADRSLNFDCFDPEFARDQELLEKNIAKMIKFERKNKKEGERSFTQLVDNIAPGRDVFISFNECIKSGMRSSDENDNVFISINPKYFSLPDDIKDDKKKLVELRQQFVFDVFIFEAINGRNLKHFKKNYYEPLRSGALLNEATSLPDLFRGQMPKTIAEFVNSLVALNSAWKSDVYVARKHEEAEYPTAVENAQIAKEVTEARIFSRRKMGEKYNITGKMVRPPLDDMEANINFQTLIGHTGGYVYDVHHNRAVNESKEGVDVNVRWEILNDNIENFHTLNPGTADNLEAAIENNLVAAQADHHLYTRNFQTEDGPYYSPEELIKFRDIMISVALKKEICRRYVNSDNVLHAIKIDDINYLQFSDKNFTIREDREAIIEGYYLCEQNDDPEVLMSFKKAVSDVFPNLVWENFEQEVSDVFLNRGVNSIASLFNSFKID